MINMSKASPAKESIESVPGETITTEADRKFLLALAMIIAYAIILLIPTALGQSDMFNTVAAAVSGPVGTIIGYYFGTKKD
jgi:hypothetical protein